MIRYGHWGDYGRVHSTADRRGVSSQDGEDAFV